VPFALTKQKVIKGNQRLKSKLTEEKKPPINVNRNNNIVKTP